MIILWILLFQSTIVKMKESEKIDNYLDLARELKLLWNMNVLGIQIVVSVHLNGSQRLVKNIEGIRIELETESKHSRRDHY